MTQHYRMTLNSAIADYQAGLISATTLVCYYFRIRLAPGWKVQIDWHSCCTELGISKASFYKALQRLKEKKLINFNVFRRVVASLNGQTPSQQAKSIANEAVETKVDKPETEVDKVETPLDRLETGLDKVETHEDKIETLTPAKPLPNKNYSQQPNSSSSSFQSFFHSLSLNTRERFLNFVSEKTKDFKPQINDVCGWLAGFNQAGEYRWRVYYDIFQSEVGEGVAPSKDWQNHPLWDIAIQCMRRGLPRFLAIGYPECEELDSKTRKAMADYAEANKLIWGKA